jgi:EmrB/QacA subfamily drug resistance transporter
MQSSLNKWIILVLMCAAIFIIAFNTTAIINVLVTLKNEFHLSTAEQQWIMHSYMLITGIFILVGGRLGDMFSIRKILIIGCCLFAISSLLIAIAPTFSIIISGRALQGLSVAMIVPMTLALINITFPKEQQTFAIGAWSAALGIGFAIGPLTGGLFTKILTWRFIYWSNIPLLLTLAAMMYLVKDSQGKQKKIKLDWAGLSAFLSCSLLLLGGLVEAPTLGWNNPVIILMFVVGFITLITFGFIEKHAPSPLIHFENFRVPFFAIGNIGLFVTIFSFQGVLYFFSIYSQNSFLLNYSALHSGIILLPFCLAIFFASLMAAYINKLFKIKLTIILGLLLLAAGCFILFVIPLTTISKNLLFGAFIICGFGAGIAQTCLPSIGLREIPQPKIGEASGILNTVNFLSGVLVVALGNITAHFIEWKKLSTYLSAINIDNTSKLLLSNKILAHETIDNFILKQYPLDVQTMLSHAIQNTYLAGFSAAMLLMALAAAIGIIMSLISTFETKL